MKRDMMQNDYVVEETGKDFPPHCSFNISRINGSINFLDDLLHVIVSDFVCNLIK